MKKLTLVLVLFLLFGGYLFAQSKEVIRVKAGEDPSTAFSPYGFYRFPAFAEGIAYLRTGEQSMGRFNYHILNQEVQFISKNGDTLALADPLSLKYIAIDTFLYYYSDGYLEVLANTTSLKLARKLRLDVRGEKIGAYGQASPSGSIRTPNRLILGNTGKDLSINQDLVIQKEYTYYWLDEYSTVFRATKANLLKLLAPDKKNSIEDYLKKNKIDFHKEQDLKKLFEYSIAI
jgi:hypothetical protein